MTDRPTHAQLLHLLNRAIDGVVLHGEGDHLRELVCALYDQAEGAEAARDRLLRSCNRRTARAEQAERVAQSAARDAATALTAQLTAEAAIERVRELHQPAPDWSWAAFSCTHHGQHKSECPACGGCYPCATVDALDQPQQPATTAIGRDEDGTPICTCTHGELCAVCQAEQPTDAKKAAGHNHADSL